MATFLLSDSFATNSPLVSRKIICIGSDSSLSRVEFVHTVEEISFPPSLSLLQ